MPANVSKSVHPRDEEENSSNAVSAHVKRAELSCLDVLKAHTKVVADTGDFELIVRHKSTDVTTNPSLVYAAAKMPTYAHLVDDAISYGLRTWSASHGGGDEVVLSGDISRLSAGDESDLLSLICDKLSVNFGCEILKVVPGVVSTEIDANLSFDIGGSLKKVDHLMKLYKEAGIDLNRVLVKVAGTWEGCEVARQLEARGIHCNVTLIFCLCQAVAAAEAKATVISPFVGRILDWYKKFSEKKEYTPLDDPGVISVVEIYQYFKKFGYKTDVMGASFRYMNEVLALSGCDRLTIPPKVLEELANTPEAQLDPIFKGQTRRLSPNMKFDDNIKKIEMNEKTFRWMLNENQIATEKLSEGIRNFNKELVNLKQFLRTRLAERKNK